MVFQKLFQSKNKSLLKDCVRCNQFLTIEKHESVHSFLKHYDEVKSIPFEIMRFPGLAVYAIEFQKHRDFYKFFNSEKCARNVRYKFKPGGKK